MISYDFEELTSLAMAIFLTTFSVFNYCNNIFSRCVFGGREIIESPIINRKW
jgi:hypothetical protein